MAAAMAVEDWEMEEKVEGLAGTDSAGRGAAMAGKVAVAMRG